MSGGSADQPSANIGARRVFLPVLTVDPPAHSKHTQLYVKESLSTPGTFSLFLRDRIGDGGNIEEVGDVSLSPVEEAAVKALINDGGRNSWRSSVLSTVTLSVPFGTDGQRYLVGVGATGTYAGKDNQIAVRNGTGDTWKYEIPPATQGWRLYDEAAGMWKLWSGTSWADEGGVVDIWKRTGTNLEPVNSGDGIDAVNHIYGDDGNLVIAGGESGAGSLTLEADTSDPFPRIDIVGGSNVALLFDDGAGNHEFTVQDDALTPKVYLRVSQLDDQVLFTAGDASNPGISFIDETNSGIFFTNGSLHRVNISSNGALTAFFSQAVGITSQKWVRVQNSNNVNPSINGAADIDTGITWEGSDVLSFVTGQNYRFKILATGVLDLLTNRITNMGDPTAAQDAATKAYVDDGATVAVKAQDNVGLKSPTGGFNVLAFSGVEFETDTFFDPTVYDSGTATGTQSASTLQDTSKAWTVNEWADHVVRITGGTGVDQIRRIVSNTADTLTILAPNWTVTPVSASSTYEISLKHRLTIPAGKGGLYRLNSKVTYTGNGSGLRGIAFYKNNAFLSGNSFFRLPVSTVETGVEWDNLLVLAAGDFLEARPYNTSGAQLTFLTGDKTRVSLLRVGAV